MRVLCAVLVLASTPAIAETSLRLVSQGDDWVGGGRHRYYTESDGAFTVAPNYLRGVTMRFCKPSSYDCWQVEVSAPFNRQLEVGYYPDTRRYLVNEPGAAGLTVSGEARGCNHSTGWLQVKELRRDSSGTIEAFWAVFEQSCDEDRGFLVGDARWNVDVAVSVRPTPSLHGRRRELLGTLVTASATDGDPVALSASSLPPGAMFEDRGDGVGELLWRPRLDQLGTWPVFVTAETASGESDTTVVPVRVMGTTRLVIDSDLGDPVGQGRDVTKTEEDGVFWTDRNIRESRIIRFGATPTTFPAWGLAFAAPRNAPLQVGEYPDAEGLGYGSLDRPALGVQSDAGRCPGPGALTGRFDVYEVATGTWGNLERFHASFQQRCANAAGELRGEILFGASAIENAPPMVDAGPEQLAIECSSPSGAWVRLDGSRSSDPDDDPLEFTWSAEGVHLDDPRGPAPGGVFPLGTTVARLTVTDGLESVTGGVTVTVVDTVPPRIAVSVDPTTLWPPNGQMFETRASVRLTDQCDPDPGFVLASVLSSEPEDDPRGPDVEGAEIGTPDAAFRLRAARSFAGEARVYTIVYEGRDGSENRGTASAEVRVPHDMGN